ncbi:hypothetical protein [Salipiger sp. PrR003]|uniref:hypothetical protein n=1 Tax=Salipiger sp. PrR003 TaxID=2706776 RepID=UPI0013D93F1F|nr:hypothetical protein [Salipiger sp. PrR003]NDV52873.1 hypothetical protein [Salipiger sp. PrR003]
MSETINDLKGAVRAFLSAHAQPVPAKTATSKKEHLEVWHVGARRRALGVEFDHDGLVNFWVTSLNMPQGLPPSVEVVRKTPKGKGWTDANGDGANSNLSGYDDFRTRPIARLGVTRIEDAKAILDHLNR